MKTIINHLSFREERETLSVVKIASRLKFTIHVVLCFTACVALGQAPTISSFAPSHGPAGTAVTITGTNFSAAPSGNIVFFGATQASVTSASPTMLSVQVPVGATYQPITVLSNGLIAYSKLPFVVTFDNDAAGIAETFSFREDFVAGTTPFLVSNRDLNGDGKTDLVVCSSGKVTIFISTSTGPGVISYVSQEVPFNFSQLDNVSVSDLDGDGKADLIFTDYSADLISVFRNTSLGVGALSFAAQQDFSTVDMPFSIFVADFDADGKADVAVSNSFEKSISIHKNMTIGPGSIGFSTTGTLILPEQPRSISAGDLDGDSKVDLLVVTNAAGVGALSVFRNVSAGTISFAPRLEFPANVYAETVTVGDVDGDGKADVVVGNLYYVTLFRNIGTGTGTISLAMTSIFLAGFSSEGESLESLSLGDLDGDSKIDIAITSTNAVLSVFKNSTTGPGSISYDPRVNFRLTSMEIFGSAKPCVSSGDLDGDGKTDIVVTNTSTDTLTIFKSPPPPVTPNCFAYQVSNFTQGKTKQGKVIEAIRSNPQLALGAPQENDMYNFVSLGFGGSLTLELEQPLHDNNGYEPDFILVETSFGRADQKCFAGGSTFNYPETAVIEVSDGVTWRSLPDSYCRTSFIDISSVIDANFPYVKRIRIKDFSNKDFFEANADGFDVDGIIVCPEAVQLAFTEYTNNRAAGSRLWDGAFFNRAPNEATDIAGALRVYPNPTVKQISIEFFSEQETNVPVQVISAVGTEQTNSYHQLRKGWNVLTEDVTKLSPGVYVIRVGNQSARFVRE